ncbi:hypothetical protein D6D15_05846 [Aureobasidium pullulans]|uniref:F-box domain-containing protein n=1 Tax=Aureobasidium pullulans TaxID=5580 RepID=A0A4S9B6Y1_AURPU|nr:hypothetical protein D6D15_05846 [Aureobasidium pullulans]
MPRFSDLPREIQADILDCLVVDKTSLTTTDRRCLLSPMRVNTFWFNHTADILWNNISKLESTFTALDTVYRRQLYVSKIRYLKLHTSRIHLDRYQDLNFLSFKRLALRGYHQGILPFLQPNLEIFEFRCNFRLSSHEVNQMILNQHPDLVDSQTFGRFLSIRSLRVLSVGYMVPTPLLSAALSVDGTNSPTQLQKLVLRGLETLSLPHELDHFLRACTSLRILEMHYREYGPKPLGQEVNIPAVLKSLSALTYLEYFRLDHDLTGDIVEECLKGGDASFRRLRHLAIKGETATLSYFLSLPMQSLTRLDLVVGDPFHHICPCIAQIHCLTDIHLKIGVDRHSPRYNEKFRPGPNDWEGTREDLNALSALKNLQTLSIGPSNINLAIPWLTDDYFIQWVTNFPDLLNICLEWECPLTFASVVALSKSHPRLRQCKLLWTQELGDWNDLPSPQFVDLQHLGLSLVMNFDRSNIREFVTKFFKHPSSMSTCTLFRERGFDPDGNLIVEEADETYVVRLDAKAAAT